LLAGQLVFCQESGGGWCGNARFWFRVVYWELRRRLYVAVRAADGAWEHVCDIVCVVSAFRVWTIWRLVCGLTERECGLRQRDMGGCRCSPEQRDPTLCPEQKTAIDEKRKGGNNDGEESTGVPSIPTADHKAVDYGQEPDCA